MLHCLNLIADQVSDANQRCPLKVFENVHWLGKMVQLNSSGKIIVNFEIIFLKCHSDNLFFVMTIHSVLGHFMKGICESYLRKIQFLQVCLKFAVVL